MGSVGGGGGQGAGGWDRGWDGVDMVQVPPHPPPSTWPIPVPSVNRLTDRCKNITFRIFRNAVGKNINCPKA